MEDYNRLATTLGEAMEGKAVWNHYVINDDGWWCYSKQLPVADYREIRAVISEVRFGRICDYQNVLVGLHLVFKREDGFFVNWEFTHMPDLQILFSKAKVTDLEDLVGTPMLVGMAGQRIISCKVNESLVVERRKHS